MVDVIPGARILVTGAGGLLGGEMAARLTAAGARVVALLRRPGAALGNDGAAVPVAETAIGDVTLPRFGLDEAGWRALGAGLDAIVHCAALTRFDAPLPALRAVNVGGTAEVLALARLGGARLLHVSTAFVNGTRDGVVLENGATAAAFNNGYEQSKAEAERLVRGSGVPAAIARPSIILGDRQTGRIRVFNGFYHLLKLFAEGRIARMPAEPTARLDLVPIDEVGDGLTGLLRGFERARGRVFHLVADAPAPLSAFPATLGRFAGLRCPEFVSPRRFEPPASVTVARIVATYAPYFRRDTGFDDREFRQVTGSAAQPDPVPWWERVVRYAVEAGFVRPDGRQASRTGPNGRRSEDRTPSSAGSR